MGFLIVTGDGRTRICTASAFAAATHVKRLQEAGTSFKLTDAHGNPCKLSEVEAGIGCSMTPAPVAV